jgi:hypothetical protein
MAGLSAKSLGMISSSSLEGLRIAEEIGDADQQVAKQRLDLGGVCCRYLR